MKLCFLVAFLKHFLFFPAFFHSASIANALVFEGSVVDAATKSPLSGATLIIKGTTKGTATDAQGRFALEFRTAAAVELTLVVSYTGYADKEIKINTAKLAGQTISLDEDKNGPAEEVVIAPPAKKTSVSKKAVVIYPASQAVRPR